MSELKYFVGRVLYPESDTSLRVFDPGFLACDWDGQFHSMGKLEELNENVQVTRVLDENGNLALLIPPLVDIHFHWVQDEVSDMDKDALLDWLQKFVFPTEATFGNSQVARQKALKFAKKLFRSGTLGGAVYGSVHPDSVREALRAFQGEFFLGNVLMTDRSPEDITQNEEDLIPMMKSLCEEFGKRYVITPRFAISCNPDSMKKAGEILRQYPENFMQTHLSETEREVEETIALYREYPGFEDVSSYLEIYDRCGLLTRNSLFGHCIYLTSEEIVKMRESGAVIAHCPSSNAPIEMRGLGSGLFDYEMADREGLTWALASDIGAGPFLSMLDVMQSFLIQNQEASKNPGLARTLYRASRKGMEILKIEGELDWKSGSGLSFVALPGDEKAGALECFEDLLGKAREDFNTLPVAVCLRGDLEVFKDLD